MCGLALVIREFNMTNKELAEILDIKPQSLNDWLKLKRKIPSNRLEQLSSIFNLSKEYFLKDESEYTEVDRLEVRKSYLEKTDILIDDPTISPYRFWLNSDEIRRTQHLIDNKKLLQRLELLIDKVGVLGDVDFSIKSNRNFWLLEKIEHLLRNEEENKELADKLRALFEEYKI